MFNRDTNLFDLHRNVNKYLKFQILASVDNIYMRTLNAKYIAYRNLSFLEANNHLNSYYYNITPVALKENTTLMNSAYEVNQPLKMVIDQIEMSINFTNVKRVPYTPRAV